MVISPENISPRSGIHTAPTAKARVMKPKNSYRKLLSDKFLILFMITS
jgi:hypothetical protein